MATYRANGSTVYLCGEGRMVADGGLFTTSAIPGKFWEPQDAEALAACQARFPDKYPSDQTESDSDDADASADTVKAGRKAS